MSTELEDRVKVLETAIGEALNELDRGNVIKASGILERSTKWEADTRRETSSSLIWVSSVERLVCPHCGGVVPVPPQIGSEWRSRKNRARGCRIEGINPNESYVIAVPLHRVASRIECRHAEEFRVSFDELRAGYELVDYFNGED